MAEYPFELELERPNPEHGRTFSEEAMEALGEQFVVMVAAAVMQAWQSTGKPPQGLKIVGTVVIPGEWHPIDPESFGER